jgi:hypothetical protein
MKNQTITPMAALRSRTAVSFSLPTPVWTLPTATAGHVSAGAVGVGVSAHLGMSTTFVPVVKTDPDLRPNAIATAKQARPPRGIPR